MKHTVLTYILFFLLHGALHTACTTDSHTARQERQLDSARTEMLVNMDYAKAESIYKDIISHTLNKLIRLLADEGMMQLCQIRSLNKTYYDYRSDAQKLLDEFKTAERHIDRRNDSILHQARNYFYRISAVYYITLRDMEKTGQMLDSMHAEPLSKKDFLATYLGPRSAYYKSLQKVWSAETLTDEGKYDEALDSLSAALHLVNLHHLKYCPASPGDTLYIYRDYETDTISTEMRWIENPDYVVVPDWIAAVREQLSITFGAMGNKAASDYNHNIYFDILDATRQDRLLDQQYESLSKEGQKLDILLLSPLALLLLSLAFGTRIYIRCTRRRKQQIEQLRQEIETNLSSLLQRWLSINGGCISDLQDEMEYANDERRAAEMKIEENKRGYIEKAASVSIANGIIPFLDRAIKEADSEHCDTVYLSELIDKINDYNDVLGHWVKIRQGSVSLHIETFPLSSLFDVVRKAQKLYESEGLKLEVEQTNAVVKADKTLTLFMINTLMDNARKFTPSGGTVRVYSEVTPDYVEISVRDTGYGMTENDTREVISANKGNGFGLMNCRGIIEKYRKTNANIFSVCHFGIESKIGEGSRIFFRLPGKVLTFLLMLFLPLCQLSAAEEAEDGISAAARFADSIYVCNTTGKYAEAIEYGDSVLFALNTHYIASIGKTDKLLRLESDLNDMPEIELWNEGFDTDYDLIIGVRNEIAIAALATNRKHLYRYNCDVFTRLYQCISQDETKAEAVAHLARINNNKLLILSLSFLAILLSLLLLSMYYYRKYILPLFNLREIIRLDTLLPSTPTDEILPIVRRTINDIVTVDDVKILPTGTSVIDHHGTVITLPLSVTTDDSSTHYIGILCIWLHDSTKPERLQWTFGIIAQYLSTALYCTSTKIEELRLQLELKQDEQRRAEVDRNRIHVQNMILDNCLSAIKHETMYYPSRIKQLLTLQTTADSPAMEDWRQVSELLHYYKEVFTQLSQCALKQLEQTVFKRRILPISDIVRMIEKIKTEKLKTTDIHIDIPEPLPQPYIVCDPVMLQYLFETLLSAVPSSANIHDEQPLNVSIRPDTSTYTFTVTDPRIHWTEEQTRKLFYPDSLTYDPDMDRLQGAEYILCKQIIREHDQHCGIRGICRIYATPPNKLAFTIPSKQK